MTCPRSRPPQKRSSADLSLAAPLCPQARVQHSTPRPPPLAQASADKGEVQEAKDMCVLYDSLQVCLWCVCVCLC